MVVTEPSTKDLDNFPRTMSSIYRSIRVALPRGRTAVASSVASRQYASEVHETSADGASDTTKEKAQPKILNQSPPKEGEGSAEVEQHNKELQGRAERPAEKASDEDVEKDKVSKGFWQGKRARCA